MKKTDEKQDGKKLRLLENMTIEDVRKSVSEMSNEELKFFRWRFLQIWSKHFKGSPKNTSGTVSREDIVQKYMVVDEAFKERNRGFMAEDIDTHLLTKRLYGGIAPTEIGEIVVCPDYVVVAKDFVVSPTEANELVLAFDVASDAEGTKEAIIAAIGKQVGKEGHTIIIEKAEIGEGEPFIPLFDLVLRPKSVLRKAVMEKKAEEKVVEEKAEDKAENGDKEFAVSKPYPGYHACRLREPGEFRPDTFITMHREHNGKPYSVIMGKKKDGGDELEEQALRYKREKWTADEASKHCSDHDGSFEAAAQKSAATSFNIEKIDQKERLVGGVVYEPDVVDAQGDFTDAEEIRNAMMFFMENGHSLRVDHDGEPRDDIVLIENFQAESDMIKGDKPLRNGSWWVTVRVNDKGLWKKIEGGEITGFSFGGVASEGDDTDG